MGRPKKRNSEKTILSTRLNELVKKHPVEGRILTQLELAQMLHVSRQTITYYLSGEVQPNWDMIADIARLYKVSTDWLLGLSDVVSSNMDVQSLCACSVLNEESAKFVLNEFVGNFDLGSDLLVEEAGEELEERKVLSSQGIKSLSFKEIKEFNTSIKKTAVNYLLGSEWSIEFINLLNKALVEWECLDTIEHPYPSDFGRYLLPEEEYKRIEKEGFGLVNRHEIAIHRFRDALSMLEEDFKKKVESKYNEKIESLFYEATGRHFEELQKEMK